MTLPGALSGTEPLSSQLSASLPVFLGVLSYCSEKRGVFLKHAAIAHQAHATFDRYRLQVFL